VLINCTFAAGFVALSPGPNWDYSAALYHCVVTATTVGYGDMLLRTQAGRVLAIFHILISTSWIASVLSHLSTKYQQRKTQLWHAEHLRMQLHPELLRSLLQGGIEEGGSIDKLHFVLGMLTNLKIVTWDDVMPFLEVFDAWDKDGNGQLDNNDLEMMAQHTEAQREAYETPWELSASSARSSSPMSRAISEGRSPTRPGNALGMFAAGSKARFWGADSSKDLSSLKTPPTGTEARSWPTQSPLGDRSSRPPSSAGHPPSPGERRRRDVASSQSPFVVPAHLRAYSSAFPSCSDLHHRSSFHINHAPPRLLRPEPISHRSASAGAARRGSWPSERPILPPRPSPAASFRTPRGFPRAGASNE